jgi:DNA-nicking Smr family endonuclease
MPPNQKPGCPLAGRRLSAEDQVLWSRVSATVSPLAGRRTSKALVVAELPKKTVAPLRQLPATRSATPIKPARAVKPSMGVTLDGSWDRALSRGTASPDLTIDLHGHSAAQAHRLLDLSLDHAIREGARLVLVITGKARPENPRLPPTSRGVIRASAHDWLSASRHAGRIAAIRNAHPRHGGGGALYVILRRSVLG